MKARKQSSTSYPIVFLLIDSTDHVTGKTGASPTVTISKNGASFGAPSGAVTEIGSGWYALAGNATDRNTLGDFLIHATASGADPVDDRYVIVPFDPFDANSLGLAYLTGAVALEASVQTALGRLPAALVSGRMDAYTGAIAADAITAAAIATGAIDADAIAADAITAAKIAANAIGASELATDAVTEIVAAVWAAAMRTVTGVSGSVTLLSVVNGDDVTVYAGDTWAFTLTVTGVTLTDYDTLVLSVKRPGQPDDNAALILHSDDGLVTINAAAVEAGDETDGSLSFDATTITVSVAMRQTVGIAPKQLMYWIKGIINGSPDEGRTLVTGAFTVLPAGTEVIT